MTSVISIENPDFKKEVRAASSALFLLQPIFNFDLSTAIFDFYMDIRNVTFLLPLQIHVSTEYFTLSPSLLSFRQMVSSYSESIGVESRQEISPRLFHQLLQSDKIEPELDDQSRALIWENVLKCVGPQES